MNNFIPDAKFDEDNAPVGDRRWWFQALYAKYSSLAWLGEEPDRFSPHTLTEENQIKAAILEGKLEPRNEFEQYHRDLIAIPRPKAEWPHKWVTCKKCGADVHIPGYPAGKQNKFTDAFSEGCYQLIDSGGHLWLWPKICQPCADLREAKPKKNSKIVRMPHND